MGTQVVRSISRVSYLVLRKKLHPKFKMYAARIVLPAARIAASSGAAVRPVAALPMVQFRGLQTTVAKHVFVIRVQLVATHTDSKTRSRLSITAMCSSDKSVSSHQRPSTHQGSSDTSSEQSNLVRELPVVGILTSNNPTPTLARGV